jgi:hypothetical protein
VLNGVDPGRRRVTAPWITSSGSKRDPPGQRYYCLRTAFVNPVPAIVRQEKPLSCVELALMCAIAASSKANPALAYEVCSVEPPNPFGMDQDSRSVLNQNRRE